MYGLYPYIADAKPYETGPLYTPNEFNFGYGDAVNSEDPMATEKYSSVLSNIIGTPVQDMQKSMNQMILTMGLLVGGVLLVGILGIGALMVISKKK